MARRPPRGISPSTLVVAIDRSVYVAHVGTTMGGGAVVPVVNRLMGVTFAGGESIGGGLWHFTYSSG